MRVIPVVLGLVLPALAGACSPQDDVTEKQTSEVVSAAQPSPGTLFSDATQRVLIEIDYMPGAEPFTGPAGMLGDPWAVARDNVEALFGGKKEIVLPTHLDEMQRIDDVHLTAIDQADLTTIAARHRDHPSSTNTVSFYVVFLNASFKDEHGRVLPRTTGLSVRGAGVIGLYKPAMMFGLNGPATLAFAEQATLVHELGHAVGLVHGGIPTTGSHWDSANGAHCNNPHCIMYWKSSLIENDERFVHTYLERRRTILFGRECLADTRAFDDAQR